MPLGLLAAAVLMRLTGVEATVVQPASAGTGDLDGRCRGAPGLATMENGGAPHCICQRGARCVGWPCSLGTAGTHQVQGYHVERCQNCTCVLATHPGRGRGPILIARRDAMSEYETEILAAPPTVDCPYWRRGRALEPAQLQEKSLGYWDPVNANRLQDRLSLIHRHPNVNSTMRCHSATPPGPGEAPEQWFMQLPAREARRNHDGVLVHIHPNGSLTMPGAAGTDGLAYVEIFGRNAPTVEVTNLLTGAKSSYFGRGDLDDAPRLTTYKRYTASLKRYHSNKTLDPSGRYPLNDMSHVATVTVPKLDGSGIEFWLPCGFHGDLTNTEVSSAYVVIIDGTTFRIRAGPRLPQSGGACGAAAVEVDGPGSPPHICSFGGTDGSHNKGLFLRTVSCYDRVKQAWGTPFAQLPVGMDHLSLTRLPAGVCGEADPERLLITNFRTTHYGGHSDTMYVYELPPAPEKRWMLWAKPNGEGRDAAGMTTANDGRQLLMFGGVHYRRRFDARNVTLYAAMIASPEAQVFDTCNRTGKWQHASGLGTPLFAIQAVSSARLNLALHCGGTGHELNDGGTEWQKWAGSTSFRYCSVTRFSEEFRIGDRHYASALGVANDHASYTLPLNGTSVRPLATRSLPFDPAVGSALPPQS